MCVNMPQIKTFWQGTLGFFLFLAVALPVNANTFVVVEGERLVGYRSGDLLQAETVLNMSSEAEITLLTARGEKIRITGPLQGTLMEKLQQDSPDVLVSPSPEELAMLTTMAEILRDYRKSNIRLRGVPKKPEPKDPWQINTVASGDQCALQGQRPILWRPNTTDSEELGIRAETLQDETFVTFTPGKDTHPWPIDLTLVDKADYRVKKSQNGGENQIVLHLLSDNLPTRAHIASALAQNKCSRQAAQLLIEAKIDKLLGKLITNKKY